MLHNIIVGSTALLYHGFNVTPRDTDIFCTRQADSQYYGTDSIVVPENVLNLIPHSNGYATPDAVYTIKCSHLGWDIKWDKHKLDVLWLKHEGCVLLNDLYYALIEYWKSVNGNKDFLNYYQTKEDFFNDYIDYKYDHDELHRVVSYPLEPLYLRLLEEGQEVAIDKEKFDELTYAYKLRLFKEEIAVIAAERWLIPSNKYYYTQAWRLALKKMFVSLTKDWQTDFLVRNIQHFNKPDRSYFLNLLEKGYTKDMKRVENAADIIEELMVEYSEDPDEVSYEELAIEMDSIKEVDVLQREGGYEGAGEHFHVVFSWKGKIYKWIGNYQSYAGIDIDPYDLFEVTPQQKMVTVYE